MDINNKYIIGSLSLGGYSPIEASISDHNPIYNNGILSFNMMMRCGYNADKKRYNNGFGLIEDDASYQSRIKMVVKLLAEAADINPTLYAIGLVEAPIKPEDIDCFIIEAHKYPSLSRFYELLRPEAFSSMGVLTLIDTKNFDVKEMTMDESEYPSFMKDRIQKFIINEKSSGKKQLQLFNLHLPFDLAKGPGRAVLNAYAKTLLTADIPSVVIGDFNMDPHEVSKSISEVETHVVTDNNILVKADTSGKVIVREHDTVDGILCTKLAEMPSSNSLKFDLLNCLLGNRLSAPKPKSSLAFFARHTQRLLLCDSYTLS